MKQQCVTVLMILLWSTNLAYMYSGLWLKTDTLMHRPHRPRVNSIWRWSKWPALAYVIGDIPMQIIVEDKISFWDYLALLLNLWVWYFYKDSGDDDPMNKLRRKLSEKVEQIKGRLVVVPVGA